jgi:hypothetical protein
MIRPKPIFRISMLVLAVALSAACSPLPEIPTMVELPSATNTPPPPTATSTPLPSATSTATAKATVTPTATATREIIANTSLGNLHMHTTCSDGSNSYEEMVQASLDKGLTFLAVTDHWFCPETIAKCIAETRLVCFPGQEVTENIHILAIGIHEGIDNTITLKEVVQRIHEQGGIAIASHPYRSGEEYTQNMLLNSGLDAMECNKYQNQLLPYDTGDMPCVYNSDAHNKVAIGLSPATLTACDINIVTIEDLRYAILNGLCHPGN